jgi:hypothetical protein
VAARSGADGALREVGIGFPRVVTKKAEGLLDEQVLDSAPGHQSFSKELIACLEHRERGDVVADQWPTSTHSTNVTEAR